MHVPGWHDSTKAWQEDGDIQMLGIIQEQHPDRARLFMQYRQMDWPVMVDSLNLLETTVVPLTLAIDEHGVIREIQPARDDLARLRSEFVDVSFPEPSTGASDALPPMSPAAHEAVESYLWDSDAHPDAIIDEFERAVAATAEDGYTLFRAGVAYRWRYDSPAARPGDFQRAVASWERALEIDPNNYIWRRRIQQYGPRLDKPYPFYDWVPEARAAIRARGEVPEPLIVEPGDAEFAAPRRDFVSDETLSPPAIDDRILRDTGEFAIAETTMVPSSIAPGESARAHVTFVPNEALEAHWNNEVDDLVFWVELPEGWRADPRVATVPNPPETVSQEPRKVEIELQAPADAHGTFEVPGYALYYVCEDVNGICLYRRQDVTLRIRVDA